MKCSLQEDELVLYQVGDAYDALADSGCFKWSRKEKCMRGKLSVETLEALKGVTGILPSKLDLVLRGLKNRERMLQEQRDQLETGPEPLWDYPVKANLMKHQVAGANMALITFGLCDGDGT